jgi:hypothetical protein
MDKWCTCFKCHQSLPDEKIESHWATCSFHFRITDHVNELGCRDKLELIYFTVIIGWNKIFW